MIFLKPVIAAGLERSGKLVRQHALIISIADVIVDVTIQLQ